MDSKAQPMKRMQEWQISKAKQDRQLESIEKGLGTLGEVAVAMGENLKHQDVLLDAIDEKVQRHRPVLSTTRSCLSRILGLVPQPH